MKVIYTSFQLVSVSFIVLIDAVIAAYSRRFDKENTNMVICLNSLTAAFIAASMENLISAVAIWSPICYSLLNLRARKRLCTPCFLINVFPSYLLEAYPKHLLPYCNFVWIREAVTESRYYQRQKIIRDLSIDIVFCQFNADPLSTEYCFHCQATKRKFGILNLTVYFSSATSMIMPVLIIK